MKTGKRLLSLLALVLSVVLCVPFGALAEETADLGIALPVTLAVEGEDVPEAEYSFELTSEDGSPLPESTVITITGAGSSAFESLPISHPGDYTYKVKQTSVHQDNFLYDDTEYNVTVRVLNCENGGFDFEVSATVDGVEGKSSELSFNNRYIGKASIYVTKIMTYNDMPIVLGEDLNFFCALFSEADGSPVSRVSEIIPLTVPADIGIGYAEFIDIPNGTYYLFETDEAGNLTVDEADGYSITPSGDNGAKVEINNDSRRFTLNLENIWNELPPDPQFTNFRTYSAEKVWENAQGMELPSIDVQLMKDGEAYGLPVTLGESTEWKYTWEDLPIYDVETNENFVYTVEEITEFDDFEVEYNDGEDKTVITNRYTKENNNQTVNVKLSTVWFDAGFGDKRPESIDITLVQSVSDSSVASASAMNAGTGVESADDFKVSINTENEWSCEWKNLPKYAENGAEYTYSVSVGDIYDYYGIELEYNEPDPSTQSYTLVLRYNEKNANPSDSDNGNTDTDPDGPKRPTSSPLTGDNFNVMTYIIIAAVAALLIAVLLIVRKKKK
ncbi:MAG: Cna B-type domain-containing protein [Clostridia bacterium]|nr:Cna B-type domain-containing protein [Clostridia bacterium]